MARPGRRPSGCRWPRGGRRGSRCFLAHLATEKALKAVLIAEGRPLRKTHDLVDLAKRLPEPVRTRVSADDLDLLDVWVMEGRYPADLDEATRAEAAECHAAAARIVAQIETGVRFHIDLRSGLARFKLNPNLHAWVNGCKPTD